MVQKNILNSAVIGFLIALFFLGVFQNLKTQLPFEIPYPSAVLLLFPLLAVTGILGASFVGKKFPIFLQAAKFLLVGVLNTFADLGVFNFLLFLTNVDVETSGIFPTVFKGVSFLVAVLNSYFWNKHWTFKAKVMTQKGDARKEFGKFFAVSAVGVLINIGTFHIAVRIIGPQFGITPELWANVGALAGVFLIMTWNFLAYKLIVFHK